MIDHPDTMKLGAAWIARGPDSGGAVVPDVRRLRAIEGDAPDSTVVEWVRPVRAVGQHAWRRVDLDSWRDFLRRAVRCPEHDGGPRA
jgi:hypothetical protein